MKICLFIPLLVALLTGCASAPKTHRSAAPIGPVLLTSPAGQYFVTDQLNSYQVDSRGVIGGPDEGWITLYNTVEKPFRLTGSVWLYGPPQKIPYPGDMPDGVGFFIRSRDGKHRYSITPDRLVVKRRSHSGGSTTGITTVAKFTPPQHGVWLPFTLEATKHKISFTIGDQSGEITGPLDMDGTNRIALGRHSKLKDLRIELLSGTSAPTTVSIE